MSEKSRFVRSFLVELGVYGALVVGYFFLVLHFLAGWVEGIFHENTRLYAVVALALMIGQGIVLEMLTSALLKLIRARTE